MIDLDIIRTDSFWSLWFWLLMVMSWSMSSHWILGVPYDLVQRADREGEDGEAALLVDQAVAINIARLVYFIDRAGIVLSAVAGFILAAIATLGFWFWIEFFQALFMLVAPHFLMMALSVRLALRLRDAPLSGKPLRRRLFLRRVLTQVIGMFAIIATAAIAVYVHWVGAHVTFY